MRGRGDQDEGNVNGVVEQQVLLGGLAAVARGWTVMGSGHLSWHAGCARRSAPGRPCVHAGTRLPSRRTGAPHFKLRGQGPFGVVETLGDPVFDAIDQRLILQQHEVHVEQGPQPRAAHPLGPMCVMLPLQALNFPLRRCAPGAPGRSRLRLRWRQ